MAKSGGKKNEVFDHPFVVTYALALLLVLSIVALVAVTLNCASKTVLIDTNSGSVVGE